MHKKPRRLPSARFAQFCLELLEKCGLGTIYTVNLGLLPGNPAHSKGTTPERYGPRIHPKLTSTCRSPPLGPIIAKTKPRPRKSPHGSHVMLDTEGSWSWALFGETSSGATETTPQHENGTRKHIGLRFPGPIWAMSKLMPL